METVLTLPNTEDSVFSQLIDIVNPIDEITEWLRNSVKNDRVIYAEAKHLMESRYTIRMQKVFYTAYEQGYVLLFQRKVRTSNDVYYKYIAVRTAKKLKGGK